MYFNRRRIELHGRPTEIAQVKSKGKDDATIDDQKTIAQVRSKKKEDIVINIDCSKCNKHDDNEVLTESIETGKEESDSFVKVGTRQVLDALVVNDDRKGGGAESNSFFDIFKACRVVEELEKEDQDTHEGERSGTSKLISKNRYCRDSRADESTKENIQSIKNREEEDDFNDNKTKTETGVEPDIENDVDSSFEFIEMSDAKDRGGISIDKKCGPIRAAERVHLSKAIHILKRHRKKVKDEAMVEMKSIRT